MDILSFALLIVLSVSTWQHKQKIKAQDERIHKLESTTSCSHGKTSASHYYKQDLNRLDSAFSESNRAFDSLMKSFDLLQSK